MKKYIFSYFTRERVPIIKKKWFGLRHYVEWQNQDVRRATLLSLTDTEVKEWFQGDNFLRVVQKIVGGTMYQLENAGEYHHATDYIQTATTTVTRARIRGEHEEPTRTNVCYPSEGRRR